jgi:Family of unknown function (DUF5681)
VARTLGSERQGPMSTSPPENRRKTGKQVPGSEATRFQPGRSGNPGGRPKTARLSQACRELLAAPVPRDPKGLTYAEAIAQMLAKKALDGDIRAAQEIADRAEGKPEPSDKGADAVRGLPTIIFDIPRPPAVKAPSKSNGDGTS